MDNEAEQWGCCFNCGKEGHRWAECTEPLRDSLKRAKERANQKKTVIKLRWGSRGQGSPAPQTGTAKADLAQAKN